MGRLSLSAVLWSTHRHVSPPPQLSRTVRHATRVLWPFLLAQVVTEEIPQRVREELKMRVTWIVQGIIVEDWRRPI